MHRHAQEIVADNAPFVTHHVILIPSIKNLNLKIL